jgi:Sigma-70, region 4
VLLCSSSCLCAKSVHAAEDPDMIAAPQNPLRDHEITAASLRTFMRLPVTQRGAVILRDVLGHSLEEICEIIGTSIPAAKSALQRGRARVHELAQEPENIAPPVLPEADRVRLMKYVECFCAHDFDRVRALLAADVELDLVNRLHARGRDGVGQYFHRYALADQWRFAPGFVDRRPAMLVFDRHARIRRISFSWGGAATASSRFAIFCLPATCSKGRSWWCGVLNATARGSRNTQKKAGVVRPAAVRIRIDSHVIEKRCNQRKWRDRPVQQTDPKSWSFAGAELWLCCTSGQQRRYNHYQGERDCALHIHLPKLASTLD